MTDVTSNIYGEDCISGMAARLADNSVHLTVTSIPFEELFTYSGKLQDVGNNGSTVDIRRGRFAMNMRFVIEQLFRVTAPGCNCCIHIQQLLAYKNQHGFMGRRDFRGAMVDVFGAGGFLFIGEFAIVKDPQAMAQRLSLHSLQFKTGYARNGCNLAPAVNDYVLIFQKPGECASPVRCIQMPGKNEGGWVSTEEWILWARGVWEIDEFDVLDGARYARESDEEKHVCPLQLELIRRCIRLYTNPATLQPDVTVLDPFMGIGSTAHESILLGRNVVGFELKESYHAIAVKNCTRARARLEAASRPDAPGLFGGGEEDVSPAPARGEGIAMLCPNCKCPVEIDERDIIPLNPPSSTAVEADEPATITCPHCKAAVEVEDCDCLGAGDSGDLYCPNCNGTIPDQFAEKKA